MRGNAWLSAEVAGELALAVSPPLQLPTEAVAFLSALAEARSFRSLYGDSAASPRLWDGSLDTFPPKDQIGATGPDGRPTHTFGAWQWEPATAGDIAVGIGTESVAPDDQIRGSWWLAQRDYHAHTGADLLTDLRTASHAADALDKIAAVLRSTWPGGARAGFSQRYLAALPTAQLPADPIPQIKLLYIGDSRPVWLDGWDETNQLEALPINGGVLSIDNASVCSAVLDMGGQWVTITGLASGQTIVHYAIGGLRADLEVIVPTLTRIAFDPDRKPDPQPGAPLSG